MVIVYRYQLPEAAEWRSQPNDVIDDVTIIADYYIHDAESSLTSATPSGEMSTRQLETGACRPTLEIRIFSDVWFVQ